MDTQKMKVQKLVPTEYNGWWGYVDKTGKKLFLLYMMTPAILIKMAKQK